MKSFTVEQLEPDIQPSTETPEGKLWRKCIALARSETLQDIQNLRNMRKPNQHDRYKYYKQLAANFYWLMAMRGGHEPPRSEVYEWLEWDDMAGVNGTHRLYQQRGVYRLMVKFSRKMNDRNKKRKWRRPSEFMPSSYRLDIELDGLPPLANVTRYRNRYLVRKDGQEWKQKVKLSAANRLPERPLKIADLVCIRYSSKEPDFDGLVHSFKPLVDGLVEAKVLIDDKPMNVSRTYLWLPAPPKKGSVQMLVAGRAKPISYELEVLDKLPEPILDKHHGLKKERDRLRRKARSKNG